MLERYAEQGVARSQAYRQVVGEQLYGGDIDSFALSLAAIRLFLLGEESAEVRPHLYVHDMLLHSPERQALFTDAERIVGVDAAVDEPAELDAIQFDAIVGNPPYGGRKPKYKERVYGRLYGPGQGNLRAGSVGTGDRDTYAMFIANGIERLREGGRLCLITNDSYRTLTTYGRLRRKILDTCKIVEILVTDTRHFEGVSFKFAGMAIITMERCGDESARRGNTMRLVDYIREPEEFATPAPEKVQELRQDEYEAFDGTPFFVGVPRDVLDAAEKSLLLHDVARGRQGLATADDARFLAQVEDPRVLTEGLASALTEEEQECGLAATRPRWVPFAKGEGFGEYWRDVQTAIDWSKDAVAELERRAVTKKGTPKRPELRNRQYWFREGLTYSVVSGGRVSVRLLPSGWIFGHKGSAIFIEDESQSELFVLGYLNSALATYFMKKIVNTTATADVGYLERLPYRKPSPEVERFVVERVQRAVEMVKSDSRADVSALREEIDEAIFDLFEINTSREVVRRFYRTVGRIETRDQAAVE